VLGLGLAGTTWRYPMAGGRVEPRSNAGGVEESSVEPDEMSRLSDTPIPDRLWDGMVAWLGGTLAVCAAAIAISNTLGWPRRPAALLTGWQLMILGAQAVACSAFVLRSGQRFSRRLPGAVVVALAAGVPGAFTVLMGAEWLRPADPPTGWFELLRRSAGLAAVMAVPVGYLLWTLGPPPWRWPGDGAAGNDGVGS
jgi:hypothetical protein